MFFCCTDCSWLGTDATPSAGVVRLFFCCTDCCWLGTDAAPSAGVVRLFFCCTLTAAAAAGDRCRHRLPALFIHVRLSPSTFFAPIGNVHYACAVHANRTSTRYTTKLGFYGGPFVYSALGQKVSVLERKSSEQARTGSALERSPELDRKGSDRVEGLRH